MQAIFQFIVNLKFNASDWPRIGYTSFGLDKFCILLKQTLASEFKEDRNKDLR